MAGKLGVEFVWGSQAVSHIKHVNVIGVLIKVKFDRLTDLHDTAKHWRVIHCATVPAAVAELVLALTDPGFGALADVLHVVLVQLAQLLLAFGQACQLTAERLCAYDVSLGNQQRIHSQRPATRTQTWARSISPPGNLICCGNYTRGKQSDPNNSRLVQSKSLARVATRRIELGLSYSLTKSARN